MRFLPGAIGWAQLVKKEVTGKSSGIISCGVQTVVVGGVDLGSVAVGDLVFVTVIIGGDKGVTAGNVVANGLQESGTAAIVYAVDFPNSTFQDTNVPASASITISQTWIFRVSVAGSLVMKFWVSSAGSNFTIQDGGGEVRAYVLRAS